MGDGRGHCRQEASIVGTELRLCAGPEGMPRGSSGFGGWLAGAASGNGQHWAERRRQGGCWAEWSSTVVTAAGLVGCDGRVGWGVAHRVTVGVQSALCVTDWRRVAA